VESRTYSDYRTFTVNGGLSNMACSEFKLSIGKTIDEPHELVGENRFYSNNIFFPMFSGNIEELYPSNNYYSSYFIFNYFLVLR